MYQNFDCLDEHPNLAAKFLYNLLKLSAFNFSA